MEFCWHTNATRNSQKQFLQKTDGVALEVRAADPRLSSTAIPPQYVDNAMDVTAGIALTEPLWQRILAQLDLDLSFINMNSDQ